jgi:hypothetical protein
MLNVKEVQVISQPLRAASALFLLCVLVYGAGIYLTRVFLCEPLGACVLIASVVIGGIGCLFLCISAIKKRSIGIGIGTAIFTLALIAMFQFIGVFTLPGCSGV